MRPSVRIRLPAIRSDQTHYHECTESLERRVLSPVRNEFAPRQLDDIDSVYIDEEDFFKVCGRALEGRRRDLKLEQKTFSQLERQ